MRIDSCFTTSYERNLSAAERNCREFVWEKENTPQFNELIVSWNGSRPRIGKWNFSVRLKQDSRWSEWLPYAAWGASGQKTFRSSFSGCFAESYQDTASPKTGLCDGFSVKAEAIEGADFKSLDSLHACISDLGRFAISPSPSLQPVFLKGVPLQSQLALNHPRRKDLCSPTSTSTAVNFLLGKKQVDPAEFAEKIHDNGFDIYGNWILNTAESSHRLKGSYRVYVKRLPDFASLHSQLLQGNPVVVSVKGKLPGAPKPYPHGHLMCAIGFDPKKNQVIVADPAFEKTESVQHSYPLSDFLKAWGERRNLSYLFEPIAKLFNVQNRPFKSD